MTTKFRRLSRREAIDIGRLWLGAWAFVIIGLATLSLLERLGQ